MRHYSKEELAWLRNNIKGKLTSELTLLFNKRFNESVTEGQIRSFTKRHKLKSGLNTRFKKGSIPVNKNKPVSKEAYAKMSRTFFRPGNVPLTTAPVGATRIDKKDGYIRIKVGEPNKWALKHVQVWEQHNGPIPEGHCIVFLDGNRQHCAIENLALISRRQLLILNRRRLLSTNKEANKSSIVLSELIDTIRTKKYRKEQKQ